MIEDLSDLILTGTVATAIVAIICSVGEWARLITDLI